jgi:hypothetical protein
MTHIGIADVCQLTIQIITGVFTIFQSTFHPYFNKVTNVYSQSIDVQICGAILNSNWLAFQPLTFVLAVNRLVTIVWSVEDYYFNMRLTNVCVY